jgi:TRAP-type C4-dicarboxylate transport system permease small subunit
MPASEKAVAIVRQAEEIIMNVSLIVIVLLVIIQVVGRYVFGAGFLWSDELVGFLLVTVSMIGSVIATREKLHTSLDVLFSRSRGLARVVMKTFIELCSVLFLMALAYSGVLLAKDAFSQQAYTLPVAMGAVYAVIPIGAALMLLEVVLYNVADHRRSRAGENG